MTDVTVPLLNANSLSAGYGRKQVLNNITLEIVGGEIVAIIGHNGSGKSTLLKVLFGLVPAWQGEMAMDGKTLRHPTPQAMLQLGVGYVPQKNKVFRGLSILENLQVAGLDLSKDSLKKRIRSALAFGTLASINLRRNAGILSGGERQMVALAGALVRSPRLMLLDEPSLGLDPPTVRKTLGLIRDLCKQSGIAGLIVEQRVRDVLQVADRVYVLRNGAVCFSGAASSLTDEGKLRETFF